MADFHDVRLPEKLSVGSRGGPTRKTQIVTLFGGNEERNASWADSRREFDIAYNVKTVSDLDDLIAFFEARNGRLHPFRFKDHIDWKSCAVNQFPSFNDQVLGVGDGTEVSFQLVKAYSSGGYTWEKKITRPVLGTVLVGLDGFVQSSGWSVDVSTGLVTFDTAPGNGVQVTSGFEYDIPVRFGNDRLDITMDLANETELRRGSISAVPIIEVRE